MKKFLVKIVVIFTALALSLIGTLAQAHHSFAMYDNDTEVTFTGKLVRFIPGANHAQLVIEIFNEDGEVIIGDDGKAHIWVMETGGSAMIARQGVTVKNFPEGTILTFTVNPLRNGKTVGITAGALIHCGDFLPEGGCTAETGEVYMGR